VREVLVSHSHTHQWMCPTTGGGPVLLKFSPWMKLDSTDPNWKMLDKYTHAVYTFIMSHPGVTWVGYYDNDLFLLRYGLNIPSPPFPLIIGWNLLN